MENHTINKGSESFSTDTGFGVAAYSENENSSQEIEKYKQRLVMKQSLLSSFSSNYNYGDDIESNEERSSVHIKFMPAYLFVYKKQYTLFANNNDQEIIENYYNEIILLSDIKLPTNFFLQKQLNKTDQSKSYSSKIIVNLISQSSIQKHIYRKIVEYNKAPQNNKQSHHCQSPKKLKISSKILKSQYYVALKLLFQQYKQSAQLIFCNILIGIIVSFISFFVVGYSTMINDDTSLSLFDLIVSIYYIVVFIIISALLYKSTIRSSSIAVKINKYSSYFFLFASLLNFGLIFFFDSIDDLQVLTIFGTAFILIFIFHAFQSIKLYNLLSRLEVLLGMRSKEQIFI